MSKDFLGNELHIGDEVVFMQLRYRNLLLGRIVHMAKQTCLISHNKTNDCRTESKQFYNQIVLYRRAINDRSV